MEIRMIDESTLQRVLFCQIQKNAIDSGSAHYDGYKNWCLSGLEVEKAINDIFSKSGPFAPTIAPETLPIGRCKDCEHYTLLGHCKIHSQEPDEHSPGAYVEMLPDDFCSYFEPKERKQ